ncbi:MAG: hypothetical protein H8D47_04925 [Planctomycetes bacterium]|nr:hypothetical protein [Planctomycetota bacterium]MBL7106408.1 hypothetical protein [Phycisphaerae bacterium]
MKIRNVSLLGLVFFIALFTGCSQQQVIRLNYTPGQSSVYKSVIENSRSVEFTGPASRQKDISGGTSGAKVEMVFTQTIEEVDDSGIATAKITIDQIQAVITTKDVTTLDFDSSRAEDKDKPLGSLIGKSYVIKISPNGKFVTVVDIDEIKKVAAANKGKSKLLITLFAPQSLEERHSIVALNGAPASAVKSGDSWSIKEKEDFDMMGTKGYEKIYTVSNLESAGGIAVVKMEAVPDTASEEEIYTSSDASPLSKSSDNIVTFKGVLEIDLSKSVVKKYVESLESSWTVIDPQTKDRPEPNALIMSTARINRLELIK